MTKTSLKHLKCPDLLHFVVGSLGDTLKLICAEVVALLKGAYCRPFCRGLWLLVVVPLLLIWQVGTWICLLLDEILFRKYHQTAINSPVFVLGPPRSGTTYMHRLLAESSPDYSTASAWELFLAPSVLQKKLLRGMISCDRCLGRPLSRGFSFLEKAVLAQFSETHPGSLKDPEEDYFYLNAVLRCSGWMLAFPAWKGFRTLLPGCKEVSEARRREALCFYRRCLQKQLYVDGNAKTLLSKNASFSSWLDLLPDFFPDARYVVCMRRPQETVPSMLSTAAQARDGFFAQTKSPEMQTRLYDTMQVHYQVLYAQVPLFDSKQLVVVAHQEFQSDLEAIFQVLVSQLGLHLSEAFQASLPLRAQQSRQFKSAHRYTLADYNLKEADLLLFFPVTPSCLQRRVA